MQEAGTIEMQGMQEIQDIQNEINTQLNLFSNFDLLRSKVQQSIVAKLTETIEAYAAQITNEYISDPSTADKVEKINQKLEGLTAETQSFKTFVEQLAKPTLKDLLKIATLQNKLQDLKLESNMVSAPPLIYSEGRVQKFLKENVMLSGGGGQIPNGQEENKIENGDGEEEEEVKETKAEIEDYTDGYTGDLLMRLSRGNNVIYIYEFRTSKVFIAKLSLVKFEAKMASCQYKNTLYASGGIRSKNNVLKEFYTFDGIKKILSKQVQMIHPRMMHCLVAVSQNYVFAIGGMPNEIEVEYFQNGKWQQYPALNDGRCNFTACYLQNAIFVFCGTSNLKGRLNSIQKTVIDKQPWIELKVQDNVLWKPEAWLSCVPINPTEILIFRCDDDEVNFIFNVYTHNLRTYKTKGGFPETSGYWCPSVKYDDKIYVPNYDLPIKIKSLRMEENQGHWHTVAIVKG